MSIWGVIHEERLQLITVLKYQMFQLKSLSNVQCKVQHKTITPQMICALGQGKDTCKGDSGGKCKGEWEGKDEMGKRRERLYQKISLN